MGDVEGHPPHHGAPGGGVAPQTRGGQQRHGDQPAVEVPAGAAVPRVGGTEPSDGRRRGDQEDQPQEGHLPESGMEDLVEKGRA